MLYFVVRIVGRVGIPDAGEQITLPRDRATLHMHAVDKVVFDVRSTPVATPDQAATLRKLSHEGEIALPARFAANDSYDVAGQSIVVHADGPKLGCAAIKKRQLPFLAAVSLEDHKVNSHLLRRGQQSFRQLPCHRFEQGTITDAGCRTEACIL